MNLVCCSLGQVFIKISTAGAEPQDQTNHEDDAE
jgi:hypothetical protein